jgi:hypothetical protein
MDQRRVAENLAAIEAHFHSEAANEVAAALKCTPTISFGRRRPSTVSIVPIPGRTRSPRTIANSGRQCGM